MSVYRVGTNKSSTNVFPSIRPTLDLDFANTKTLDPRITFTRASGGSYVGADGLIKYAGVNEARFDHDPETGESLGLLVEEARTNLLLQSENFSSGWTLNAVTLGSTIVAPNGTYTAPKIEEDNTVAEHRVGRGSSGGATTSTVCYSVFVKAAERTKIRLAFSNLVNWVGGGGASAIFDLTNGTAITSNSTPTAFGIIPYPNGWYRCFIAGTPTILLTVGANIFLYTTSVNYQGDGTSGIYLWGAQLEVGAFPTSYIPTQGSTRTRAVDNAQITGRNFSEWYRPDEGTVFAEASTFGNAGTGGILRLVNSANTGKRIRLSYASGTNLVYTVVDSTTQVPATLAAGLTINTSNKGAAAYQVDNFAGSANGLAPVLDTLGTVPSSLTTVQIGADGSAATTILNGTIRRLTYWPKRLSNAQLQALTK
jgi:hypothetical protein